MVAPKKGLKGVFLMEATKKQYPEQEKDVNEKRPKSGHKKIFFTIQNVIFSTQQDKTLPFRNVIFLHSTKILLVSKTNFSTQRN